MSVPPVIGRHDIVSRLGAGATATVWLAHDPQLDSPVAIKVLADILVDDAEVRRRFLQEARFMRAVDSDAVVRTHDVGELPDGRPYIVMTFADGGTLEARAKEPWAVGDALRMGIRLASAVGVLHASGVLHRDIKPSNVVFRTVPNGPDGPERLLLADLGLGKPLAALSQLTLASGTPGYAPPEQFSGEPLTTAADVYGVAGVVYRLLSGTAPNEPRPGGRPLPKALTSGDVLPGVPAAVRAVLAAGLSPNPAARPSSADELAARLRAALDDLTDEPPPPRRSWRLLAAAIAVALLAGASAAGTAWWLRPVRLTDVSQRIAVELPRSWTAHVDGGTWDATAIGGPAQAPSLLASDTGGANRFAAGSHAVFVGVAGQTGAPGDPAGCSRTGARTLTGTWRGDVSLHDCSGQVLETGVLSDAAGTRVLVQIARPPAETTAADDVLAGLTVRP